MADKPVLLTIAGGAVYTATKLNSILDQLADGIEGCLGRGGVGESPNSMTANIDMDTNEIINLGDPTSDQAAATKAYADAVAANIDIDTATAADLLTAIKTVDGSGSGLDAGLLQAFTRGSAGVPLTVVSRDASGDFGANEITSDLVGDVVGNTAGVHTGDVSGDVTGDVSGDANGSLLDIEVFTSSGTWTKPSGCTKAKVICIGGGGGGGGCDTVANSAAGGGGSGGYGESFIASSLGATETVTVGSGGAGGVGFNNGSSGTASSFGTHVVVRNGVAAAAGNGTLHATYYYDGVGGLGGTISFPTVADIKIEGNYGGDGIVHSTLYTQGGVGGVSPLFCGKKDPSNKPLKWAAVSSYSGEVGSIYGGGGGGGARGNVTSGTVSGGAGVGGIVIVVSYK